MYVARKRTIFSYDNVFNHGVPFQMQNRSKVGSHQKNKKNYLRLKLFIWQWLHQRFTSQSIKDSQK